MGVPFLAGARAQQLIKARGSFPLPAAPAASTRLVRPALRWVKPSVVDSLHGDA